MKAGKLSAEELEELVLSTLRRKRDDILVYPRIGEDCAVVDFDDQVLIISTDPITGADEGIGSFAVNIACNDVVANGGEPVGIQLTILIPPEVTKDKLRKIMLEVEEAAAKLNVDVLGGHTEITSTVNKVIISTTAIGRAPRDRYVVSTGARPGDDILVTKAVGLEGTAILARDYPEVLKKKGVPGEVIKEAGELIELISVVPEGLLCAEFGVHAMHDITEGGLLGALWELAYAAGVGFVVDRDKIPVFHPTAEICSRLGLDPLRLISSGSLLVITDKGSELKGLLGDAGINAEIIGKIREGGYRVVSGENTKEIAPPFKDELWRWLENQ